MDSKMRKLLLAGSFIICLRFSACSYGDYDPAAPRDRLQRLSVFSDCTLGDSICAKISDAIYYLEEHPEPFCAQMGQNARARFEAVGYGYRQGDNVGPAQAYIWQDSTGGGLWGWESRDQNVYINDQVITQDNVWDAPSLSKLIFHEEFHHYGWGMSHNFQPFGPPPPPCEWE